MSDPYGPIKLEPDYEAIPKRTEAAFLALSEFVQHEGPYLDPVVFRDLSVALGHLLVRRYPSA